MVLAARSRVKVADLVPGLIVLSGNDAAMVIAEGLAGSEANFARLMSDRAAALGFRSSTFRNASGLGHPEQLSTVRDLAGMAAHIIATYPDQYPVFQLRDFTYNKIRQSNRNPLLAMDIGADGLKTGNISESGFGLVGSAVQGGRRLIVAINGAPTARDRAIEARRLLEYGFRGFEPKLLFRAGKPIGDVRVFAGDFASVPVAAAADVIVLLPRQERARLSARIVYKAPLRPPIRKGQAIALLVVTRGETVALQTPLLALEDVQDGGLTRRAVDAGLEYARILVNKLIGLRKT
jgi:D-alanyl-D-alanine carboxypeptidase (penicillin-binding protein 5/6)